MDYSLVSCFEICTILPRIERAHFLVSRMPNSLHTLLTADFWKSLKLPVAFMAFRMVALSNLLDTVFTLAIFVTTPIRFRQMQAKKISMNFASKRSFFWLWICVGCTIFFLSRSNTFTLPMAYTQVVWSN